MDRPNIVILDGNCANPGDLSWSEFESIGNVTVYGYTAPDQLIERAREADVVIDNKVIIDAAAIAALPRLKYIGLLSTGYNVVDIAAASARGIEVCNVPSYSTMSVAQHSFALLLSFVSRVAIHDDSVKRGDWSKCDNFCYWLQEPIELCGKTYGVIGYGEIGAASAKIAAAMGMRVIVNRRSDASTDGYERVSLDELIARSDVIDVHCDLNAGNAGLIGADFLSKVKRGAIIINTARGGLADERAVRAALDSGVLGGYLTDVLADEPPKGGSPLIGAPNCVITPHIAWASIEARSRLLGEAAGNLRSWLEGKPRNSVIRK